MEYFVGVALALGAGFFATRTGFDRDRAFYPATLIVVASYYDLFAVIGGGAALGWETCGFAAFLLAAIIGFRTTLWVVVVALIGHGLLDLVHGRLIANPGVPAWWQMFCFSYDVVAGAYLAWRLLSGRIIASDQSQFGGRIQPYVEAELKAANVAELAGDPSQAFRHLERAHVLGQRSTVQHVRVHLRMLTLGMRHHQPYQVKGQIVRLIGAALATWIGFVPQGNTGGSNVNGLKPMVVPDDLAALIAAARSPAATPDNRSGK